MMTDPVADMLTRIRNAYAARHQKVDVPISNLKLEVARILKEEGFINNYKVIGDGVLAKADNINVVFCQLVPWQFEQKKQLNLKRTFRRSSCLVTRLAANMGVAESTPILDRFRSPVEVSKAENRWLDGLYLDVPEEWDDPYRFFRW